MTKIDIISGFLGAGKTTFIKKLLEEAIAGEKVVLIENEFGEIGIDGSLMQNSGIEVREMNSGCICCSLVGDFGKSLAEVLTTYAPDRVIIEPSGVGKLSDVMKAVCDVAGDMDVELNGSVNVVDAQKCRMYMKNFGEFFNNQIESAGTIILSRTDIANPDKVAESAALVREKNPTAAIVTTPINELTGAQLLALIEKPADTMAEELMKEVRAGHRYADDEEEEEEHEHHHHGHEDKTVQEHDKEHGEDSHHHHHHDDETKSEEEEHEEEDEAHEEHEHEHHHHHEPGELDADDVFQSWGFETNKTIEQDKLRNILEELSDADRFGEVLRAKGMIPDEKGTWHYFDLVPGQIDIKSGDPVYTGKVCVIGSGLKEEALKKAFEDCEG